MNNNELSEWILGELEKREMSQADLARASGLREGTISRILSGFSKNPSPYSLKKIAKAFGVPVETVYARAGLVNEKGKREEFADYVLHLFDQLAPMNQAEVIEIMRLKLQLQAHAEGMTSDMIYAVVAPEERDRAQAALHETLVQMGLYRAE